MENLSIFLAKFWGLYMVILIGIFLVRPSVREDLIKLVNKPGTTFIGGFIAFLIGLGSILLHNRWGSNLEIIISLIGWLALVKGIINIAFPTIASSSIKKMDGNPMIFMMVLALFFGAFLVAKGFYIF